MRPAQAKMADKRLSIEIAAMRQSLWREPGQETGNPAYEDKMPEIRTDYVRWVDTDVMIADPLTKAMDPSKMQTALDSNFWDLSQPIESVIKKRAKQLSRRKTQDPELEDVESATDNALMA